MKSTQYVTRSNLSGRHSGIIKATPWSFPRTFILVAIFVWRALFVAAIQFSISLSDACLQTSWERCARVGKMEKMPALEISEASTNSEYWYSIFAKWCSSLLLVLQLFCSRVMVVRLVISQILLCPPAPLIYLSVGTNGLTFFPLTKVDPVLRCIVDVFFRLNSLKRYFVAIPRIQYCCAFRASGGKKPVFIHGIGNKYGQGNLPLYHRFMRLKHSVIIYA